MRKKIKHKDIPKRKSILKKAREEARKTLIIEEQERLNQTLKNKYRY